MTTIMWPPRREVIPSPYSTTAGVNVCRCREMTGGTCPACSGARVLDYAIVNVDTKPLLPVALRSVARIIREFALRESSPVRVRLEQIATAVEAEADGTF